MSRAQQANAMAQDLGLLSFDEIAVELARIEGRPRITRQAVQVIHAKAMRKLREALFDWWAQENAGN